MLNTNEIAILHPARFVSLDDESCTSRSERIGEYVDHIRDLIYEAAEEIGHRINCYEYAIFFDRQGRPEVPGRNRRKGIENIDTTVVIDPSDSVLAFASSNHMQPIRRTLVVTTEVDGIDRRITHLTGMQSKVFDGGSLRTIQHAFALYLSPNNDQKNEHFLQNRRIVEKVLRYPKA